MRGIRFAYSPPVGPVALSRMDVACFIGFTPMRAPGVVSGAVERWWAERGWWSSREIGGDASTALAAGLPVPIESWDAYESVFATGRLDRAGSVHGDQLPDQIALSANDRSLRLLVDGREAEIVIRAVQTIGPEALVRQLNRTIAETEPALPVRAALGGAGDRLRLERTDEVARGELTVYRNVGLGFPQARQQDVVEVANYLSAAVREFFEHGGRKCFVVRVGDALPVRALEARKVDRLLTLVWGRDYAERIARRGIVAWRQLPPSLPDPRPGSGSVWQPNALSYLTTLPEVTYVSLPDIVDLVGHQQTDLPAEPAEVQPEVFAKCGDGQASPPWFYTNPLEAPVCDSTGFAVWSRVLTTALRFLEDHAPLVQLAASVPLPAPGVRQGFEELLASDLLLGYSERDADPVLDPRRRLQLAFPWLKNDRSSRLPGGALPPEGPLVGILADGALTQGAYRSLAGTRLASLHDVLPRDLDPFVASSSGALAPADRISWFGFVPGGIELSSDVTATSEPTNRFAVVRRIMILVQRAAYEMGLSHVFDANSERTWRAVERKLGDVLAVLYQKNGLRGRSEAEAFAVACDRSTMSQSDIDNGRLIANVTLRPAVPVEQIAVDLLLESDGRAFLRSAVG